MLHFPTMKLKTKGLKNAQQRLNPDLQLSTWKTLSQRSQPQQMQTPPENLPFWMLILQGQRKKIMVCFLKHTKQPLNNNQSIAPTLERSAAGEWK